MVTRPDPHGDPTDAGVAAAQPRLLVFSDDWGRHPSSCQHLISRLLPRFRTTWVNTIGMRPPRFDRKTLSRGVGKLRCWTRPDPAVPLPENLSVLQPVMWPWFRTRFDRQLNRRLLVHTLERWRQPVSVPVIGVTTIPVVADLMDEAPVDRWVYYCVDDFSQWPGLDQAVMDDMERAVIDRADVLIAASGELQNRMQARRPGVHLLTHGVDLEHWQRGRCGTAAGVLDLNGVDRPVVTFWGLIDRRMDPTWVRQLADRLERGTVLLVGPTDDADPQLAEVPRVCQLPSVPYARLPELAAVSDVLIMPYADLPVTRAMQPLKLLEYLATGRPVVVRDLPATREWSGSLDLASDADEFCAAVLSRLETGLPEDQTIARRRLQNECWQAKAETFANLILADATSVGEHCS